MNKPSAQPATGMEADFLVVGSGVAGLRAALELCKHGRVLIVTKGSPLESNSIYAQGGVAVALSREDNVQLHYSDTIKAGHRLGREEAARVLVEEGPTRIQELIAWGAQFDKVNGKFAYTKEGAHSRDRVLRARGDATGHEIVRVLMERVRKERNIQWLKHHFSMDFLMVDGRCGGLWVLDESRKTCHLLASSAVILSTGGAGQVFSRTSNPGNATGDGLAMAYRAGALLEDMEFVQFHPTSLYHPSSPPFLLSETMRGEGGLLRNRSGELFMSKYHRAAELAPRDIVARAIWSEMAATRSTHVYLDVTHLGASYTKKRFPTIYKMCLRLDIDITEEWIPISPSAHYMMGGIKAGIGGETTIPGLFAAGEVGCNGVHGANRLASNSLLEGLVFGMRAARSAANTTSSITRQQLRGFKRKRSLTPVESLEDPEKLRNSLRRLMWEDVGLVRTRESLVQALAQLAGWESQVDVWLGSREDLEVKNMVQVSRCITEAALWRENSVGAHYRADFPGYNGSAWKVHSQVQHPDPQPHTARNEPRVG